MVERKFTKRNNGYYCSCGGQIAVEAVGHEGIPLGLGFRERKDGYGFGIDFQKRPIIQGFCMSCAKRGVFRGKVSKTIHTRKVRKVTEKIQKHA